MNVNLLNGNIVWKVQINPQTTAKGLMKTLDKTGGPTKASVFTVRQVLYPQIMKGRLAKRSRCSKIKMCI